MKEEKEIRFIINNGCIDKLAQHITKKGFKLTHNLFIEDKYYDYDDYSNVKNEEGYRHRRIDEKKSKFTYKKKVDGKVFEQEYNRDKFYEKTKDKTNIIKIKKKRRIFKKDDYCELIIDSILNLGNYFEIECQSKNPLFILSSLEIPESWLKSTNKGVTEIWLLKNLH